MCIAFWVLDAHPVYKFLLALNRDEFHSRPTLPVHRWPGQEEILGGQDAKEGGTWLAVSETGRVAFLTNFREPHGMEMGLVSRGQLPILFLKGTKTPAEYLEDVASKTEDYAGFNLVVADLTTGDMACISNRPQGSPIQIKKVSPGVHCLSNANLDSPWPKALLGRQKLENLLLEYQDQPIPEDRIINDVLNDRTQAEVWALPKTGVAIEWEHKLSSIFVDCEHGDGHYGTRSMAVISVYKTGEANFYEKYLVDGVWKDHNFAFHIPSNNTH